MQGWPAVRGGVYSLGRFELVAAELDGSERFAAGFRFQAGFRYQAGPGPAELVLQATPGGATGSTRGLPAIPELAPRPKPVPRDQQGSRDSATAGG